ncbi:MAG: hypothetical protein EYC62_07020 [Alphaproteobacteria bacterium]|nr:MAG: hypothetical protein EYC62_07020 [Alphaproteobacteria bacterium]
MIGSIYQSMISAFRNAGQKLEQVAYNANPETATGSLDQSIIAAKLAEHQAEASAAVYKKADEMEDQLLDILA